MGGFHAQTLIQKLEQSQEEMSNLISTLAKKTQGVKVLEATIKKVESEKSSAKSKLVNEKVYLRAEMERVKLRESQLTEEGKNFYTNVDTLKPI